MRIQLKQSLIAGTALCAALATALPANADGEVVMQDPGGAYGSALREFMYDPFEEETGIDVITALEARGGPRVKAQVESGRTEWDITFIFDQEVTQLADCCLADIDYSNLTPAAQEVLETMPDYAVRDKGIALQVIGVINSWNTEVYDDPENQPDSWADFWDVEAFPGARCLPKWPRFVFEAALMADGVAIEDLYPIDMDRALEKIEEIKPHVSKWWETGAQAPQLLLDGEADMCMAYVGRISALMQNEADAAPVDLSWNQGFIYYDFFSIPKNSPNPDGAMKLLSWRMDPERAAQLATVYPGVPLPSPLAYEAADPAVREYWPNNPDNMDVAVQWSAEYWGSEAPDGRTMEEYGQERLNQLLAQ